MLCCQLHIHTAHCCKQGIVHSRGPSPAPKPRPRLSELSLPCNILDFLKLGAHLDDRVPDQTWIERQSFSQGMLCAGARVEAHDEVVAVVMGGLQFLRWLREEESTPVRDAAHDAVLLKDHLACSLCDSEGHVLV